MLFYAGELGVFIDFPNRLQNGFGALFSKYEKWRLYLNIKKSHDDVIKWKHFPRYLPFVRGIHRSPMNSPHKGQWRWALMFSLICARINGWVNNGEAGDLRRHLGHYNVTLMQSHYTISLCPTVQWTHLGRATHICVSKLAIIGSDSDLSPGWRQAFTFIGSVGTNFSEILSKIHTFTFKKIHLKTSSAKWRPFSPGLNVLIGHIQFLTDMFERQYLYCKSLGKSKSEFV